MNLRELLEKRAVLVAQARALLDKAGTENRALAADEQAQWDRIMGEVENLTPTIDRSQRQSALEDELDQPLGASHRPEPGEGLRSADPRESPEVRAAFGRFIRSGVLGPELRALAADVDSSGGFLTAPMQFVRDLIKGVDDQVFIRQPGWATVRQVEGAQSLGVASLEADPADADWTSELATGSEDSSMTFGKRELAPKPLAKRIKVSRKLIRLDANAEGLVRDRLAYKFGITWEKAAMTGSGAGRPLGVFTASASGIPTGRDVLAAASGTDITIDGLIDAKYFLKAAYWPKARWLFHRDAVKQLAKIKSTTGEYIWRESARVGEPDRLLNLPIFISEYVPNTFTTGLYVGILGDFSYYWIADSLAFEIQRLEELYAEAHQVGFIGRLESDGQPVLGEAFARVKLP
jgi:HK97 family phage major capsid protein